MALDPFARRLDRLESTAQQVSVAQAIHEAAGRPRRIRQVLEQIARQPGLAGRIARGDLRIGRIGSSTEPIANPEHELAQQMAEFFDDPIGFVMWSWEWSSEPALRVVRLPDAYRGRYASEHGPELWALEFLEEIGRQIREHGFDGAAPVPAIRMAVASGHGISKSATTAMLVNFIMSTRPDARGVITASTAAQLESKTWAEVQKWAKRSVTADWWQITTGNGAMRMLHRERPEWRCDAQTARQENSESFAGLHSASSSAFFIFDESSGVPDSIFEVAQGGLTDGEPFMISFGNPTRNYGWFHQAFHGQRHRWTTRQIDSREVSLTNKAQLQQWVDDYGEDSDFVRVRVRGVFPSASSLQFIPTDLARAAAQRIAEVQRFDPLIIGVDVARFGDDQSVIWFRRGRDAKSIPPIKLRQVDTMELAARVAQIGAEYRPQAIFVDEGGVGGGVVDRLRQLRVEGVIGIQFGAKASAPSLPGQEAITFANQRAYMWGAMRDWLKGGAIPNDSDLVTDLTGVEYGYTLRDGRDAILLESKSDMKHRGLASPDLADALALTFAMPVRSPIRDDFDRRPAFCLGVEYDPLAFDDTHHRQRDEEQALRRQYMNT